jgi:hypothetical protein
MHRIQSETVLLSPNDQRDYKLTVRILPVIPPLRGQHFAARPVKLISVSDQASISTRNLYETYGVSEQDASRACVENVEKFLQAKTKSVSA